MVFMVHMWIRFGAENECNPLIVIKETLWSIDLDSMRSEGGRVGGFYPTIAHSCRSKAMASRIGESAVQSVWVAC
ncbi:hypothetical protein Cenrod_1818 [Candidatus Symbiobacter mobilis CR]|uniref:Uncharacterized protein n=1 Tax=Candidatus Symbiobacter mobilis CR TaxID=946483 RepID=U5N947_9BURK|nr:hypothetical protein Cenrod_1818 [Candidatus Symbiobacter mobilis CR]